VRNPAGLSATQRGTLASIRHTNRRLYTAYLLKVQLRAVFEAKGYRVTYTVRDATLTVLVVALGHRREIFRGV
jgi:mRNA-degrading endonuclease RelE of RelBE toxin-antitoxin system